MLDIKQPHKRAGEVHLHLPFICLLSASTSPGALPQQKTMDQSTTKLLNTLQPRPGLIELPYDIFINILDKLSSRDAFRLSLVCKAFRNAPLILAATYAEPFTQKDFEQHFVKLELLLTRQSREEDNYDSIKAHWYRFISSLREQTGSLVCRLTLWRNSSRECLLRYQELCPHIRSVDFTDISCIGSAHIKIKKDIFTEDSNGAVSTARWKYVLQCTNLLSRLSDVRLRLDEIEQYDGDEELSDEDDQIEDEDGDEKLSDEDDQIEDEDGDEELSDEDDQIEDEDGDEELSDEADQIEDEDGDEKLSDEC